MKTRKWKTWLPALALVSMLPSGAAIAQQAECDPGFTVPFQSVLSMIWEQLGLGDRSAADLEAPLQDPHNTSPEGGPEGADGDKGADISPDG